MALSETDIVNQALIKLDVPLIVALTDKSKAARIAAASYAHLRDVVLADAIWNFAMRRVLLTKSADELDWGEEQVAKYALPNECLRVWRVWGADRWNVEGRFVVLGSLVGNDNAYLYTSAPDSLPILYIHRVTETADYSPLFVEALAARCALEWARPLMVADKVDEMARLYEAMLADARSVNGQEGTPEDLVFNTWSSERGA